MKIKNEEGSLYFIGVIPPNPLQAELMQLKEWVFKEVNSKGALRSPAHITLQMPFTWKQKKEGRLLLSLETLASTLASFEIALCDFNCFQPRVIYVDIVPSIELNSLKQEVMHMCKTQLKLNLLKDLRGFNPHITIAFRDLKKPQFYKIWEQLKTKSFKATFKIDAIALLKHNGKRWDVYKKFDLA